MTDLDAEIMKNRRFREKYEPLLEQMAEAKRRHDESRSNYGEGHQIGEVEPVEEETKEEAEKNSTEKTGEHE